MKHDLYEVPDTEGLGACHACGASEGELTVTDCPGALNTDWHRQAVFETGLDFINGCWVWIAKRSRRFFPVVK